LHIATEGGSACLIEKSLNYQVRTDVDVWIEGKFDSLGIEVLFGGRITSYVVYKLPSASWMDFLRGVEEVMCGMSR